jgi:hypothetical protein
MSKEFEFESKPFALGTDYSVAQEIKEAKLENPNLNVVKQLIEKATAFVNQFDYGSRPLFLLSSS